MNKVGRGCSPTNACSGRAPAAPFANSRPRPHVDRRMARPLSSERRPPLKHQTLTRRMDFWMRRVLPRLLILAFVLGCGTRGDPDFANGHPLVLAGSWDLQLYHAGDSAVDGSVRFDSTIVVASAEGQRWRSVTGHFSLDSLPWLKRRPIGPEAKAMMAPDGSVSVQLAVAGQWCGDCGNIILRGHLRGRTVSGKWLQEFLGDEVVHLA